MNICKNCNSAELEVPRDGHPSYLVCPSCSAMQLTYNPQPHQEAFHADPASRKAFFGGYGSGKTRTTDQEVLMLAMENPGTVGLITAATVRQLNETSMKTFFTDVCPPPLIKEHKKQESKTIMVNGTELLWYPSDDEGKLRSLNLGFFKMEEASEQKHAIYTQLETRLRDSRMKNHVGLLSSNPDLNWIKTEILLRAGKITGGDVDYRLQMVEQNPNISVHIAPTYLNKYLPPDFVENLMRSKPEWWIRRYLEGGFEHTEGAVYPNFSKTVIEPFEIPKHWFHFRLGHDHGLRNPTAAVFIAVNAFKTAADHELPKVVAYDLHYEAGKLVPHHAEVIKEKMKKWPFGSLQVLRTDPSTRNKDPLTGKSVQGYYQEHGIFFQPANNSLDYGLAKVNTYIETGALKIFSTLKPLIDEGVNYKYPEQELVTDKNPDEKPRKYQDHAMDALRYAIVDLPDDPNNIIAQSYAAHSKGKTFTFTKDGELKVNVQDDDEDDDNQWKGDNWLDYYSLLPIGLTIGLTKLLGWFTL